MRSLSLVFILLCSVSCFAQERLLIGKITVKDATPAGVRILNLVSEKESISDAYGNFSIVAKTDDLLVFSAVHLDYMRHLVDEEDMKKGTLTIELTAHVNQLDEVDIVRNNNINAVSMGILSKPAKQYTPAERRLKTATDLNLSANMGTMAGVSLSLDPLLNWMSGRTKMLKSEVQVERHELAMKRMETLYEPTYYTEHLKIPATYVHGFEYFCAEDKPFAEALQKKDKLLADFLLIGLAADYRKRLESDEKQ